MKITIKKTMWRLDFYKILEDWKTLNPWQIKSAKQIGEERKKQERYKLIRNIMLALSKKLAIWSLIIWVILICWDNIYAYQDTIQYWPYNQAVTVFDDQVKEMKARWYSKTKILDLLALKSMECNRYDWNCIGIKGRDIWPFQINNIHREQFKKSKVLLNNREWAKLFNYQLTYANWLVNSYDRFCNQEAFQYVWKIYNNEERFKCIAKTYNWSPRYKYTYAKIGYKKRVMIKEYLKTTNLFNKG